MLSSRGDIRRPRSNALPLFARGIKRDDARNRILPRGTQISHPAHHVDHFSVNTRDGAAALGAGRHGGKFAPGIRGEVVDVGFSSGEPVGAVHGRRVLGVDEPAEEVDAVVRGGAVGVVDGEGEGGAGVPGVGGDVVEGEEGGGADAGLDGLGWS